MSDVKIANKQHELVFSCALSEQGKEETRTFGWPFFRAGIVLTNVHDGILLVREAKERIQHEDGSSEWVSTENGKWNLPSGRLRLGENFQAAASREGIEETNYDFELDGICHIGFRTDADNPYLIVIYHATTPYYLMADALKTEEIAEVTWFDFGEVLELESAGRLRNAEMAMTAIENVRNGRCYPDDLLRWYKPKNQA